MAEERQTETVVHEDPRPSGAAMAQRAVYFIGGIIVAILVVRLIFQLFGANQGNDFVDFVYALSGPFVAPFYGIFGEPTYGRMQLETSTLIAIIVYSLITGAIAQLLGIGRRGNDV